MQNDKQCAEILAAPLQEIAEKQDTIKQTVALWFFGKGVEEGIFNKAGVAEFYPIWVFKGVDVKIQIYCHTWCST